MPQQLIHREQALKGMSMNCSGSLSGHTEAMAGNTTKSSIILQSKSSLSSVSGLSTNCVSARCCLVSACRSLSLPSPSDPDNWFKSYEPSRSLLDVRTVAWSCSRYAGGCAGGRGSSALVVTADVIDKDDPAACWGPCAAPPMSHGH